MAHVGAAVAELVREIHKRVRVHVIGLDNRPSHQTGVPCYEGVHGLVRVSQFSLIREQTAPVAVDGTCTYSTSNS